MNRRKLIGTVLAATTGGVLSAFKIPTRGARDKKLYSNWDYDSLMHYAADKYYEDVVGLRVSESRRTGGDNFTRVYHPELTDHEKVYFTKPFVDILDKRINQFAGEMVADGEIKAIYWA